MPDLSNQIEADAALPNSASNDMGSVSKRSLSELIEADKYLKAKESAAQPHRGIRFAKTVPPGSV